MQRKGSSLMTMENRVEQLENQIAPHEIKVGLKENDETIDQARARISKGCSPNTRIIIVVYE